MKRFYFCLTALALLAVLCGCQLQGTPNLYEVTQDGQTFTVDQEQCTITCDGVVYPFEVSSRGRSFVVFAVTYPDGSSYSWTQEDHFGYGGGSPDYAPESKGYVPGDVLWDVLNWNRSTSSGGGSLLVGIFLLALGGLLAAAPRAVWMLEYGWRFKSVEPSDLALVVHRITGIILVLASVVCLLAALL